MSISVYDDWAVFLTVLWGALHNKSHGKVKFIQHMSWDMSPVF